MQLPKGIVVDVRPTRRGLAVVFTHQELGPMGALRLTEDGVGGTHLLVEIAPGATRDARALRRLELLSQAARACLTAMIGTCPPLPDLERTRQKVALYEQFRQTSLADAAQLVRQLSDGNFALLLEAATEDQQATLQTGELDGAARDLLEQTDVRALLHSLRAQRS